MSYSEVKSGREATGGAGGVAQPPEPVTARVLKAELGSAVVGTSLAFGDLAIQLERDGLLPAARLCRDHPDLLYDYLMDVAAMDYLGRSPRFEMVYNLYSLRLKHRVRLHVPVPEDDPTVDSLYDLWPAADWFEREAWDLMGIRFRGHPRLVRILTHAEFVGHALRKDYHPAERHRLSRTYDLFTEDEAGAPEGGNSR
jgi:NADH:ubiquinone oxidoreductase subunit C